MKVALTPVYADQQTVSPLYGTIKVEFSVEGAVTQDTEHDTTTTTYRANASWTIQYETTGVTETNQISGQGEVVIVTKQDPPHRTTTKTAYGLDPRESVAMRKYGPGGAARFGVAASVRQKCCYFGVDLWDVKVQSHLKGEDSDGQTWTDDYLQAWNIQIPSRWQGLNACLASGKPCPAGIVEGTFSEGKTFGSYSAPVFFYEAGGVGRAGWEPHLRALGEPLDGSGLPYVQGTVTVSWNLSTKVR